MRPIAAGVLAAATAGELATEEAETCSGHQTCCCSEQAAIAIAVAMAGS